LDIPESAEIVISRNFLARKEGIRSVNGLHLTEDEFEATLCRLLFPNHYAEKPTFRQIISHNIRYEDENVNNTLRTLDKYTSDVQYETLHLFLLGCNSVIGNLKEQILLKIQQEQAFKNRLEKERTKTAYETTLALLNDEIAKLELKKNELSNDGDFESNLIAFDDLNAKISLLSSEVSRLKLRRQIILEAKSDLEKNSSNIDMRQLELIYTQATQRIAGIQKTFEELVNFHNQMIVEKVKFIAGDLPALESRIKEKEVDMTSLLRKKKITKHFLQVSESFGELERINSDLNDKHRQAGEYKQIIGQIEEVEKEISKLNAQLDEIDNQLFSEAFELIVKTQKDKFNKYFSSVSNELYGESYALNYNIVTNKKGQKLYKFNTFNTNFSSGKKQGEISCFDIAYTLFADEEGIPCLHFLLNDKKELMHDNQLASITELVNNLDIQFVASILKDKLPEELNNEDFFVLKLSPSDKIFRIENLT
jgi:uncharacterized protein YydD (DUF2326 family)